MIGPPSCEPGWPFTPWLPACADPEPSDDRLFAIRRREYSTAATELKNIRVPDARFIRRSLRKLAARYRHGRERLHRATTVRGGHHGATGNTRDRELSTEWLAVVRTVCRHWRRAGFRR